MSSYWGNEPTLRRGELVVLGEAASELVGSADSWAAGAVLEESWVGREEVRRAEKPKEDETTAESIEQSGFPLEPLGQLVLKVAK